MARPSPRGKGGVREGRCTRHQNSEKNQDRKKAVPPSKRDCAARTSSIAVRLRLLSFDSIFRRLSFPE